MRQADSLYWQLEYGAGLSAERLCDPIFTPFFTSLAINAFGMSAAAAGTFGAVAGAIAAGGEYWEFEIDRG